ncbi:MAG: rod shape-determining protein MreC, partial [Bacteroidales bacterium]
LKMEVARLDEKLKRIEGDASLPVYTSDSIVGPSLFSVAQAVNVTTTNVHNYVTLNKGRKDGIAEGMGVINRSGVVGIISGVSDHFSVVISLLNPKLRLSCKVKGRDYFGSLSWDGESPEYVTLEELPRHVEFLKGDTIITSGYSSVFPSGIMIGTVEDFAKQHDENFYAFKIKLSIDYFSLGDVCVIANPMVQEKAEIEEKMMHK